ncbi:hypothetical protein [Streptomyces javensis]|uniref:Uncharacterized protein n=1 Tax=Streptomyces javensis TaxID=114698 RepID=A0ABS0RJM1_9ACTN|nr:hypothetical protein [Streptomyces javensis]MBI0317629.1 hypothetical protein [Streptomyces javensis]
MPTPRLRALGQSVMHRAAIAAAEATTAVVPRSSAPAPGLTSQEGAKIIAFRPRKVSA